MQARLRAQLGDWPKYSGERRRRSVVVASMVLTITDPLRGSYPLLCYLQAALIRPYGASFACMELTIISRFQRLQASTKIVTSFAIFMVFQCFQFSHLKMQRGLKCSTSALVIFSQYYMCRFYFAMQASIASASFLPCKPREMMRPSGSKIIIWGIPMMP